MVKSNVVSVSVSAPEGRVDRNSLTVDKTSGYVGDVFHFTGHVEGWIPDTSWWIWIKIYVNGVYQSGKDVNLYPAGGDFSLDYSFDFTPDAPGSYNIYTDAVPQQTAY